MGGLHWKAVDYQYAEVINLKETFIALSDRIFYIFCLHEIVFCKNCSLKLINLHYEVPMNIT